MTKEEARNACVLLTNESHGWCKPEMLRNLQPGWFSPIYTVRVADEVGYVVLRTVGEVQDFIRFRQKG